jgi:hypothetical protein
MRVAIAYRDAGERSYEEKYEHDLLRRLKNKPPLLASISRLKSLKWQLFLRRCVNWLLIGVSRCLHSVR